MEKAGISRLFIALTLVVGVGITAALFQYFVQADKVRATERLQRGTDAIIQSISMPVLGPNPFLETLFGTMERLRADLPPGREVDQAYLDAHFWETPPFGFETSTFEYLPRVSYSERNELSARFGDGLPAGFSILEGEEGQLSPAGERDEYYPVLYEAKGEAFRGTVIGLDRGHNPLLRIALEQARDTGEFVTYSFYPQIGTGDQIMVNRFFYAMYESGAVPETVGERREQLRGFVSLATYFDTAQFADLVPESYQGLEGAFIPRGEYPGRSRPPAIQAGLDRGTVLETPYEVPPAEGLSTDWLAVTRASPEMIAAMVSPTRWWVLSVGLLFTAWVVSLLFWSRRYTRNVMGVVHERTQALAERTEKLSEVNAALRESEARYRMLADNATDVIYTHDLDGICTYISPSITGQTGFEVADYVGYPVTRHLTEESAQRVRESLDDLKRIISEEPENLQDSYTFEFEMLCRDGGTLLVENMVSFLTDDNGVPNGVLGVSRDISERKRSEREKRELEEAYRQSQKLEAIGTLAGGVAHDFNNLLTGILGHTELLKMKLDDVDEAEHGLNVIEKAALRAKELTSQLLGYARKGRYQTKPVDLNEAVSDISHLIERTVDKKIVVTRKLGDTIPSITGDPGQVSQLILNLVINAKEALPGGGEIVLETDVQVLDDAAANKIGLPPGTYSVLKVADNGVGMTREKQGRIFEPFFTDKKDGSGTGMGLAMVYGVAKNHDGIVTVDSQPGEGAVFTVYIPYARLDDGDGPIGESSAMVSGNGNILVVDDESLVRDMAKSMLDKLGYDVLLAKDGVDAVEYYRRNWQAIDLVILDIIMPTMSGMECLKKLREINPEVKAILATGYSEDSLAEKINREKIQGFLQKPFRMRELSELVSSNISG